MTILSLVKTKI